MSEKKVLPNNKKSPFVWVISLVILALASYVGIDLSGVTESNNSTTEVQSYQVSYQFRNEEYLQEHFQKHGAEFAYESAQEYEEGANKVIAAPDVLHKIEAEDGDDVYYLESTNEFVIVSTDGYIRTYFKPEDGIEYYNRQ